MAAAYYWMPKWTGNMYDEKLGKLHFWLSTIFVNVLFFPQHFLGLAGMPRRIPDYSTQFTEFNQISSIGGFAFGLTQLLFVYIVYKTCPRRRPTTASPPRPRSSSRSLRPPAGRPRHAVEYVTSE